MIGLTGEIRFGNNDVGMGTGIAVITNKNSDVRVMMPSIVFTQLPFPCPENSGVDLNDLYNKLKDTMKTELRMTFQTRDSLETLKKIVLDAEKLFDKIDEMKAEEAKLKEESNDETSRDENKEN